MIRPDRMRPMTTTRAAALEAFILEHRPGAASRRARS